MNPNNKTTIIFIIVGLVVAAAAAYLLFFNANSGETVTGDGSPVSDTEFTFINLAAQIEPIVFDTSVLEDPRFLRLVDLRTAILPETPGKANPFAPL